MGIQLLGKVLAAAVAVVALLAAVTGLCIGCEVYKLIAHARGVRPGGAQRVDLTELGAASEGEFVVQFTHPLCNGCGPINRKLVEQGHEVLLVDVSKHRDLASKYHVTVVPFVLKVARDGVVVERLA